MSVQRRSAVLRTSLQAWAEHDIDRMVDGWAPYVVWDMAPYRFPWRGPAQYVGIAEVLAFLATWMATWRTQDLWLEELLGGWGVWQGRAVLHAYYAGICESTALVHEDLRVVEECGGTIVATAT